MPIQMIDATGKVLDSKAIEKMYKEIECKITEVFATYNLTLGQVIDVLNSVCSSYRCAPLEFAFIKFCDTL